MICRATRDHRRRKSHDRLRLSEGAHQAAWRNAIVDDRANLRSGRDVDSGRRQGEPAGTCYLAVPSNYTHKIPCATNHGNNAFHDDVGVEDLRHAGRRWCADTIEPALQESPTKWVTARHPTGKSRIGANRCDARQEFNPRPGVWSWVDRSAKWSFATVD